MKTAPNKTPSSNDFNFRDGASEETLYAFFERLLSDKRERGWGKPHWSDTVTLHDKA